MQRKGLKATNIGSTPKERESSNTKALALSGKTGEFTAPVSTYNTCVFRTWERQSMTDLKRKTVFLPFRLWDLLSKEAKIYNITVSQLMEKVVKDYFRLPHSSN